MSFFGGGGWVLKEIWSMSLNNPFFFTLSPSQMEQQSGIIFGQNRLELDRFLEGDTQDGKTNKQ